MSLLLDRQPGHALVQQVFRLQQTVPPRARWQRVFGISPLHPDAKPWYTGAVGEIEVGRLLAALPPEWVVLHSVPLSASGTDVDHIAVGPGGIFTINTKHHRGARVWVGGRTLLVNGQKTDYVVKAEAEARRVQQRLDHIEGAQVRPVIAVLGTKDLTVESPPRSVAVRRAEGLARWLRRRPTVLSAEQQTSALATLADRAAWPTPAEEVDLEASWFRALHGEVEAARIRRMLFTLLGLVLATPVFLFFVTHLLLFVTHLLPPLVTTIFGLLLPHS